MEKPTKSSLKTLLACCLIASQLLFALFSCGTEEANENPTTPEEREEQTGESTAETETEAPDEPVAVEPRFPEYVLEEPDLIEPEGFKGTEHVVIGKDGYLYENGYINELYGYSQKYVDCTDADLQSRTNVLQSIQEMLTARGIAFCVVISPSKASLCEQFIPDFHKERFETPEGYVRPYIRFKQMLEDKGIYFVDSATVYQKIGLTNTFPKTGIHWNKLASFETVNAIIDEYNRQTGRTVRKIVADNIIHKSRPPEFVGNEQDIFGIVYSGQSKAVRDTAIVDDYYFWPDAYIDRSTSEKIEHMIIQGGSFTGDFNYYFPTYHVAGDIKSFYYNNGGDMNIDWAKYINKTSFVLLEVNEQFVYGMGGNAPSWGHEDYKPEYEGNNIIDSLYDYLVDSE